LPGLAAEARARAGAARARHADPARNPG